jgi:hypothetical protein
MLRSVKPCTNSKLLQKLSLLEEKQPSQREALGACSDSLAQTKTGPETNLNKKDLKSYRMKKIKLEIQSR